MLVVVYCLLYVVWCVLCVLFVVCWRLPFVVCYFRWFVFVVICLRVAANRYVCVVGCGSLVVSCCCW